jgi:aminoglycoside 3-N-acetyltransferase
LNIVYKKDIINGFKDLGIISKSVVVHSSLSSFGYLEGGADTLIGASMECFENVMMPAFSWVSNMPPPKNDRPQQNGCDYDFYKNWPANIPCFNLESADIEKSMGIVSKEFLKRPDIRRSYHPWHSWAAYGKNAEWLTEKHNWLTTHSPLERLIKLDGYIVLIGVNLSSCTAIHIAEERIGREPFVRWVKDINGETKRVAASGCGKGFHKLMPYVEKITSKKTIGMSKIIVFSLSRLIDEVVKILIKDPGITKCSDSCIRCRDTILGGPKISNQ